jgi:hypothetical protein
VEEISAGVRRLLPGWRVREAATLEGSDRAVVQRLSVLDDHGGQASVVAKLFTTAGEGPVREAAALSSFPPGLPVPRLLAEQAQPPLLVMTDAGAGPSVADALLGGDPGTAETAGCTGRPLSPRSTPGRSAPLPCSPPRSGCTPSFSSYGDPSRWPLPRRSADVDVQARRGLGWSWQMNC